MDKYSQNWVFTGNFSKRLLQDNSDEGRQEKLIKTVLVYYKNSELSLVLLNHHKSYSRVYKRKKMSLKSLISHKCSLKTVVYCYLYEMQCRESPVSPGENRAAFIQ